MSLTSNEPQHKGSSDELSVEEGIILVKLARQAIRKYLGENVVIKSPDTNERLRRKAGVFVTLTTGRARELRGCIGFPYPEEPLVDATIKDAIYAATEDPRFQPVLMPEFEHSVIIELTVLTPPRPLTTADRKELPRLVEVGRHGLIVERGSLSGLLLPQVATEWKWDSAEFLTNCCLKAGLPPDAWLLEGVNVKVFEGQIFGETKPGGDVASGK
jgi:uncharacterized protein (TIGR00296 family)